MTKEGKVKKFFGEFKKFITRGNVLDMAVGIIVGGAFTAIVNALSNNILKPVINWLLAMILGKEGLTGAVTYLSKAYTPVLDANGDVIGKTIDLANSIYIDWGAFISAIINFLLIAFVLFMIVRTMNKVAEANKKMIEGLEINEKQAIGRICRELQCSRKVARKIYEQELAEKKAQKEEEARIAAEKAAEEARIAEEKATANTRLLEEIRDLLKNK